MPTQEDRFQFLMAEARKVPTFLFKSDIKKVAAMTHGFSFDDLDRLFEHAKSKAWDRTDDAKHWKVVPSTDGVSTITPCAHDDPEAMEISKEARSNFRIVDSPVKLIDLVKAKAEVETSVTTEFIELCEAFKRDKKVGVENYRKEKKKEEIRELQRLRHSQY
jgi:SpoVK/Ycf46/Vps4 family AAA+-type ATPase